MPAGRGSIVNCPTEVITRVLDVPRAELARIKITRAKTCSRIHQRKGVTNNNFKLCWLSLNKWTVWPAHFRGRGGWGSYQRKRDFKKCSWLSWGEMFFREYFKMWTYGDLSFVSDQNMINLVIIFINIQQNVILWICVKIHCLSSRPRSRDY